MSELAYTDVRGRLQAFGLWMALPVSRTATLATCTPWLSYGSDRKHRDGHDLATPVREIRAPGRMAAATF